MSSYAPCSWHLAGIWKYSMLTISLSKSIASPVSSMNFYRGKGWSTFIKGILAQNKLMSRSCMSLLYNIAVLYIEGNFLLESLWLLMNQKHDYEIHKGERGLWSSLFTCKYFVWSNVISINAAAGFLHSLIHPLDTQSGLSLAVSVLRNI